MPKPEYEFHVPVGEWQQTVVDGMLELVVSKDVDTGDYSRIVRLDPGADMSPMGVLTHNFWEEVYIIHGDLTDLTKGETFYGGMYACRPPYMKHGPYRSRNGCLMFESRYAFQ